MVPSKLDYCSPVPHPTSSVSPTTKIKTVQRSFTGKNWGNGWNRLFDETEVTRIKNQAITLNLIKNLNKVWCFGISHSQA